MSSGRVWAGSPTHVQSFRLCVCLCEALPSLYLPFPSSPSYSLYEEPRQLDVHWQARAAYMLSDRLLFLTLCMFVCACMCSNKRGSESPLLACEGSDFCGRAVRSLFPQCQINASSKEVAAPDESHPPLWRVPLRQGICSSKKQAGSGWVTRTHSGSREEIWLVHCVGL